MFFEKEVKTVGQYFNMKIIFSFILGIIAGVLFSVPLVERGKFGTDFFAGVFDMAENITPQSGISQENTAVQKTPTVVVSGENSFIVIDQNAGPLVIISMASISESGWVAIHEETLEGTIGNILGARRFMEGKYFGSAIELLRATERDRAYYAVLHSDDGDNVFTFETEVPVVDTKGDLIKTRFTTIAE